jgi:hypothetical protein
MGDKKATQMVHRHQQERTSIINRSTTFDAFMANDGLLWLDFGDLRGIYHQEKMDVNFVAAWYL